MEVIPIDVHVHLCDERTLEARGERAKQMARYFGRERQPVSIDEMADQYRARKMMAAIQNTTDETIPGILPVPNDHMGSAVRKHPDVFLGFGIVDPWQGKLAIQEVRRCKEELGLHGIGEFNPARQHFYPNDPRFYPVWPQIQNQKLKLHHETDIAPAYPWTPGGMGTK